MVCATAHSALPQVTRTMGIPDDEAGFIVQEAKYVTTDQAGAIAIPIPVLLSIVDPATNQAAVS
jgi:hypothetical protein